MTHLVEVKAVEVVFLDSRKAFDTVLHSILPDKLSGFEMSGFIAPWVKDWLKGRAQSIALNGATPGWRPASSGVPRAPSLGPVLFNLPMIWMHGVNAPSSKVGADTKLGDAVDSLVGQEALQNDLDRLEH